MGSTDNRAKLGPHKPGDVDDEEQLSSADLLADGRENKDKSASTPSSSITTPSGAVSRARHDSNSSSDSARSPSTDRMKRRRTTSLSSSPLSNFFFPPPSPSSPPPNRSPASAPFTPSSSPYNTAQGAAMSLDDVMSAVNGVTNMALAHEIALDSNFKLTKFEPPQASFEKQVRDVMQEAFWDNLREQLNEDPPVYTQAFVLMEEVRDQLLEITLPHQRRLRQDISEKMDLDLIKQQAEHGVLDFPSYSSYVVDMMSKMCAPVRDEAIQKLKQQTDVVAVFSGVAETMDLMKLDMANFTIQMIRPTIVKQIVQYERSKFKEFLSTQQDGLELTRCWLLQHIDSVLQAAVDKHNSGGSTATTSTPPPAGLLQDTLGLRAFCGDVLNTAYMELLQWPQDTLLPETVCVDSERVLELRDRLHQVCLLASVMLLAMSTIVSQRPSLRSCQDEVKAVLKKDLCLILDPACSQSETLATLPNLVEQVIATLHQYLQEHDREPLEGAIVTALRQQLSELRRADHHVLALVTDRGVAFLKDILSNTKIKNISVPVPFNILQEEFARICGSFLRLTQHNRAVFGEYYFDMVEKELKDKVAQTEKSVPGVCSELPKGKAAESDSNGNVASTARHSSTAEEESPEASAIPCNDADDPNKAYNRWDSLDLD